MTSLHELGVAAIAAEVRARRLTAVEVTEAALERISLLDRKLNCFTAVLRDSALAAALRVDERIKRGENPGPLAGVPFGVKNLYDIAGHVTLAGSMINRESAPATADATVITRLKEAGAVLIGAQNMDEYAYGFTTENAHYGPTHNPRDPSRVAGGSSGGSAAAVAAGMVPLSLGSDTNGSIRVPASLCGIFGLKPTFGRLSRAGMFPFVYDLDHVGLLARNVIDLALAYDAMQGADDADAACAGRAAEPSLPALDLGVEPLRVGVLDGWFRENAGPQALAAVDRVARALGARERVTIPESARARAAAFCLTAAQGANLHLSNLRTRPGDFDPVVRDRLLAGALMPAAVVVQAQRLRQWFREQVAEVFRRFDILLAPATPCAAPFIGQATMDLGGIEMAVRPNLGLYTQPLSFIGLPVVVAPIAEPDTLPIGVQIVAPPWQEPLALRVAAFLERSGIAAAPVANP